ncbi:MAG: sulfotransferase domain-containing protein [Phycisphaerales bacterium JB059]
MSLLSRKTDKPVELRVGDALIASLRRPKSERPSVLSFSLPKAGSVMLENIMVDLSRHAGLGYFSLETALFEKGVAVDDTPADASKLFFPTGYCYGGFRRLPSSFEIPILGEARKILLVRDPRDMLVSLYFSITKSHRPPGTDAGQEALEKFERDRAKVSVTPIDVFMKHRAERFSKLYLSYDRILDDPALRVYRYEDVLYEKRAWVADICDWFGWEVGESARNKIADAHDLIPGQENEGQHVRKAHPGDHREKLDEKTIKFLNGVLAPILERHAYER